MPNLVRVVLTAAVLVAIALRLRRTRPAPRLRRTRPAPPPRVPAPLVGLGLLGALVAGTVAVLAGAAFLGPNLWWGHSAENTSVIMPGYDAPPAGLTGEPAARR